VVQLASWAGTLIVVRLLTPVDYGLMAKVGVVCALAGAIAELGLESAIVRSAELARQDLRKLYAVALLFGAGVTAAVMLSAPLLAQLFQEPRLTWPIVCAALQILITAVAIVPSALWTRDLSFRRLSQVEMAAGTIAIATTLLLAVLGAAVWALVLGNLVGALVRCAALLTFGERAWPLFSFRGIAEHLKFGLTLVANRVTYFIVVQSDVLIGSAFLTTTEIGQYAVALQLATLPMAKVMGIINQILLPAVARQQDDRARVRQGLQKSIGLLSLIAFPVLWGISAVAPELVLVLLGEKWLPTVPALVLLPLIVPIRMVCSVMFTTSLALGNRQLDLRNTIMNFTFMPTGFFVGAHWGLVGLCIGWIVAIPLAACVSVPPVLRFMGIRARDLAAELGPPALSAGLMYGAVAALRTQLGAWPPALSLVALSVAGAAVYFGVIALVSRRHLAAARSFARTLLGSGAPKPA
jgi:O-antigen/teichoic acid export membrane protein